jgi:hypothetical protein
VRGEEPQEVEFLGGEMQLLAVATDLALPGVERQTVERHLLVRRRRLDAAEHRPHAGTQLPRRERLGDVVVSAQLGPDGPVRLLAAGCHQDHRHGGAAADPPAELQPVGSGQHHVEDDQVRRIALEETARVVAVRRLDRPEAVALEVPHHHIAHIRVVVDHQHRRHRATVFCGAHFATARTGGAPGAPPVVDA